LLRPLSYKNIYDLSFPLSACFRNGNGKKKKKKKKGKKTETFSGGGGAKTFIVAGRLHQSRFAPSVQTISRPDDCSARVRF
jgi:hypothetical protein